MTRTNPEINQLLLTNLEKASTGVEYAFHSTHKGSLCLYVISTFASIICKYYDMSHQQRWNDQCSLIFTRLSRGPLIFLLIGDAIFKDFSYLFGAKFTCAIQWCHDHWPIGVSDTWCHFRHSICQSLFSSMNLWYDSNPFRWNKSSEQQIDAWPQCLLLAKLIEWNGYETHQIPLLICFADLKVHNVQEHSYHFDRIDQ